MSGSNHQGELVAGDGHVNGGPRASADASVVTPLPGPSADAPAVRAMPKHLHDALGDAENLMTYAAEEGVEIPLDVRRKVLAARLAAASRWTDQNALDFLQALTILSTKLKPVSGESLRDCNVDERASKTMVGLWVWAFVLTAIIVPFSVLAFVALGTCESIQKSIEQGNELAVTLSRLRPPAAASGTAASGDADVAQYTEKENRDLQQFAATIRDIERNAVQLKRFDFEEGGPPAEARWRPNDPARLFELPKPTQLNVVSEVSEKIVLYQDVRAFAQSVQERVQIAFGAVTSCVLPMLYALLGACAFLIRTFEQQRRKRTFTGHAQLPARLLIAGIGGLVVGLFGNFGEGHSHGLSPLAVAFMVGYAVDVFFYFIDGLLHSFARPRAKAAARGSASAN